MYLTFKHAIIASTLIHSMIIFCIGGQGLITQKVDKRDIIVIDYVVTKEPKEAKVVKLRMTETPKIELSSKVEDAPASANAATAKSDTDKDASRDLAVRQARVKATKDYINYYQLIREKIRRRLKDRYRGYHGEGDVSLIFVLNSGGSLVSAAVDQTASTRDRILVDAAVQSLKEAAPFAPFPKAISIPQMSFTLTVSFKKR